jgi:hypothetical protein
MNYIKQLTAVIMRFTEDDRLNTAHVSLYLALFQLWNMNRFRNPISLNRMDVMKISKIGSRTTYHRCMKELDYWGYLHYIPSHNPLKGSRVKMFIFETSSEQEIEQVLSQQEVQAVSPSINTIKKIKTTKLQKEGFSKPSKEELKSVFTDLLELEKFFNYYESNGWKIGGRSPMKNWKAAAKNWMLNAEKFNPKIQLSNLHLNQDKDYDIPL